MSDTERLDPGAATAVFLVSALVLALQVAFMRALAVDTFHHFTYLVISTALLGFGASGTLLSLLREHIRRHFHLWGVAGISVLGVSSAFGYQLAVELRPDLQYVLYSAREVLLLWAHSLVLFVPFFAGGLVVGMALTRFRRAEGATYAANLIGSGLGGIGGVLVAFVVGPYRMPGVLSFLAVAALAAWVIRPAGRARHAAGLIGVALSFAAALAAVLVPIGSSVDQYKAMAHAERVTRQGDGAQLDRRFGPRAQIDVYDVPSMHHTLFAKPGAPQPPPQFSLFLDGAHAGGLFRITAADEAPVLRELAQSLAYRMAKHGDEDPRVAVLGERTGVNVWLALTYGAESVTVVQANPQLTEIIRDLPGPSVFDHPAVRVVNSDPRLFLERARAQGRGSGGEGFDLIHIAAAEGMPAGAGGLASMREDYLLTVSAMQQSLDLLSQDGVITVTRGLQTPPRDNIRLFALLAETLRQRPGAEPAAQLAQARNYLGVTTLAAKRPLGDAAIKTLRAEASALSMDVDYHPGIRPADLTERNRVPGPEASPGSYFYTAAQRILSEQRDAFYRDWVYDVTPPTDRRPYFHSFFRWDSLSRYLRSYGSFWFQRVELGYAVVVVTFLQVLLAALVLVLVPVLLLRRRRRNRRRRRRAEDPREPPRRSPPRGSGGVAWTVAHFGSIGIGFLFLEMLHIQRLTRFLGDPIYATGAVLTAILVFSGVGSWVQGRIGLSALRRVQLAGMLVAALALIYYLALDPVLNAAVDAEELGRFVVSLIVLFPISFMLGWLMPAGLALAGARDPELIPLAWAVNGVASVAATPLSVMVAVGGGFMWVTAVSAAAYLFTAALARAGAEGGV